MKGLFLFYSNVFTFSFKLLTILKHFFLFFSLSPFSADLFFFITAHLISPIRFLSLSFDRLIFLFSVAFSNLLTTVFFPLCFHISQHRHCAPLVFSLQVRSDPSFQLKHQLVLLHCKTQGISTKPD